MPLIECPDCGKKISDRAFVCLGCGRPMTDERRPYGAFVPQPTGGTDLTEGEAISPRSRTLVLKFLVLFVGAAIAAIALFTSRLIKEKQEHTPPEMVQIQPGSFTMIGPGWELSELRDARRYSREVTITRPFFMSKTEVTQQLWMSVMETNPSRFKSCSDCPVEQVDWLQAVDFCNRLSELEGLSPCYLIAGDQVAWTTCTGYRLPTEAEWEYAARAGSTEQSMREYLEARSHAGPPGQPLRQDCPKENSMSPMPVGCSSPNEWGLYDMHGNVSEW